MMSSRRCGGISTTEDAVEYMLAGATAVQVGTATFVQPAAMTTIIDGLVKFCERRDIARVAAAVRRGEFDSGFEKL